MPSAPAIQREGVEELPSERVEADEDAGPLSDDEGLDL